MPRKTASEDSSMAAAEVVATPVRRLARDSLVPPAIKKGLNWAVATGAAVTTIVAIVNDILVPNGPLTVLVLVIAVVGVLVTYLPASLFSGLLEPVGRPVTGHRRMPARTAFAVSAVLAVVAVGINQSAPVGGVIGANVPAIHDAQVQLGIVSANTAQIAEDVAVIKDELKDVKQETSEDPRKELANLGVPWSTAAFVEALKLGDERSVSLFLDGGMSPSAVHKGASAVVFILQPGLTESSVPMLKLLVDKGFDLDTILTDDYVMIPDDPYSIFPPQFENEDPPLLVGSKHFEGPALLWVVMVATWYGPTDHDIETINFLLEHGAERDVAMNYMTHSGTWNDTPPYTQVLELLKR